jgi:hypothetical protein
VAGTRITVPAGAGLLLYTDGIIESFCDDGTRLGETTLRRTRHPPGHH